MIRLPKPRIAKTMRELQLRPTAWSFLRDSYLLPAMLWTWWEIIFKILKPNLGSKCPVGVCGSAVGECGSVGNIKILRSSSSIKFFYQWNVWFGCFCHIAFLFSCAEMSKRIEIGSRRGSVFREITMPSNFARRGIEIYQIVPIVFLVLGKFLNFGRMSIILI